MFPFTSEETEVSIASLGTLVPEAKAKGCSPLPTAFRAMTAHAEVCCFVNGVVGSLQVPVVFPMRSGFLAKLSSYPSPTHSNL